MSRARCLVLGGLVLLAFLENLPQKKNFTAPVLINSIQNCNLLTLLCATLYVPSTARGLLLRCVPLAMGIFRHLHVFLVLFKWCALIPYVPEHARRRTRRRGFRSYLFRIVLALVVILVVTYLRATILTGYSLFLNFLSYVMWLLASTVDTLVITLMLIANGLNVSSFETLVQLLDRIERAIEAWLAADRKERSEPPYRVLALLSLLLCIVYNCFIFLRNFQPDIHLVLQIRWELLLTDLYLFHVLLLLFAIGQCADRLRWMCCDAIDRDSVGDFCAVLQLRDDLLQCVRLVNRIYAVLFLGVSASWIISITCIVYFDIIYSDFQFNPKVNLYIFDHLLMVGWRSALVVGLLAIAGSVAGKVKKITQLTQHCGITSLRNRRLANMIDKLLIKCHFQDISFTVYGLFPIDNSLNYMVVSSIVTYLVIITQFRQLEIENEKNVPGMGEPF